jgi:hypothetical protein
VYHIRACGYLTFHPAKNHTPIKMQSTLADDSIPKPPLRPHGNQPKDFSPQP